MHTAPAEVAPEPDVSSNTSRPQLLPDPERAPRRRAGWIVLAVSVAALIVVGALQIRHRSSAAKTSAASLGNSGQILRVKGTTEAVQSRSILAPALAGEQVTALTLIRLARNGSRVKQGEVLVEFDRQAQLRDYVDKQAEYQKLADQVAEEQAKEIAAKAKDETELRTAEDTLRKAEFEMQKAEIVSRIDAEKKQEDLDEARATYDQLRQTFDLKRKAAEAAIRILEIQRDRKQQTMLHAQANAELMQIHSPLDGVVVLNTIWKQGTVGEVQEGDQVRPGIAFLEVVNPAIMQVRVLANQQDFPSLHVGQTAKVRLDAYPEMVFPGKIDQMAPIAQEGDFSSKLRSFVVIVAIQGNDPKLMPDLSAAVDVNLSSSPAESKASSETQDAGAKSGGSL